MPSLWQVVCTMSVSTSHVTFPRLQVCYCFRCNAPPNGTMVFKGVWYVGLRCGRVWFLGIWCVLLLSVGLWYIGVCCVGALQHGGRFWSVVGTEK